ncbi:MAG: diaminopimelate epimerase [Methanomassiliicoccales archaeon]|nr:diaminopimelate epimerase [Methanomassiliicoccales archaeon]
MKFWKYHGIGNDFILFDDSQCRLQLSKKKIVDLCDRHYGIGADGILVLEQSRDADAKMRVFNADGSEAEMCGNGIRCMAKHLYDFSIVRKEKMRIATLSGIKEVRCIVQNDEVDEVIVDMGRPSLDCSSIPMKCEGQFIQKVIDVGGRQIQGTAVSMGNPHFVTFEDFSPDEMRILGPLIEKHPVFPRRTNVEFARIDAKRIVVDVFERGAGWTLACGTGACAAAVAAAIAGLVKFDEETEVRLPGGGLWVTVPKDLSSVTMRGPAVRVFSGEIELE